MDINKIYIELIKDVIFNGTDKEDRTGVGTRSVFGKHFSIDVSHDNFPLLQIKKTMFDSLTYELLWFLKGDSSIDYLQDHNVNIWNEWADVNGELGPIYGVQWRSWPITSNEHVDQLQRVIDNLSGDGVDSRRHIVSAWNVSKLDDMALMPCHILFQFYSRPVHNNNDTRELDIQVYQRSQDLFLGAPFNYASYALLLLMIAQVTGHTPGTLHYTIGDLHLYKNHTSQVNELLKRTQSSFNPVHVDLNQDITSIDDFTKDDIRLTEYEHKPWIPAPVSV